MFKTKFDHSDLYHYLPDNLTVGTFDFYKRKFGEKFPDYIYELMEIEARVDDRLKNELREIIFIQKKKYQEKLISEYLERELNINDLKISSVDNNE